MEKEMTRYAFISHMEDYLKKLITDPLKADTDEFLKEYGIDGPKALKIVLKKRNGDDDSAIVVRKETIKDNGVDETGKKKPESFIVKYRIPRKDYTRKMRDAYIELFESNIIPSGIINEGCWGYEPLDSDQACDKRDEFIADICSFLSKKLSGKDVNELWDYIGIAVDFIKRYDLYYYREMKELAMDVVRACHICREDNDWQEQYSEPDKLRHNINNIEDEMTRFIDKERSENEKEKKEKVDECDGGACAGGVGATAAASSGQFTQPLFGKPIKRTIYITEEQEQYIKEATAADGNYVYTAPMSKGEEGDKFYKEALDHKDIMKKSFEGNE